jgi:hypothetical protein
MSLHAKCHVLWLLALALVGCAAPLNQFKPFAFLARHTDGDDNDRDFKDNWAQVGKEARGNRPLEDDGDPLNKWLRSPKAAAIENNLGIR